MTVAMTTTAQDVVRVGKGSYASYTPFEICYSEFHTPGDYGWKGDQSKYMQYRRLYLREREGQPIPTNDWWTNLITQPYSGRLWSYPQFVQAQAYGVDVQAPSYWISNGTEMKSNTVVSVKGIDFNPEAAIAESWHDWDVEFSMQDGDKRMYATMAHGMPFTWIETQNIVPQVSISRSYQASPSFTASDGEVLGAGGERLSGTVRNISMFALRMGGDVYGIYLPENSGIEISGGKVTVDFRGARQYVIVGILHDAGRLAPMARYAYSVPRDTKVTWLYAAGEGKMKTVWTVNAEDLKSTAGTSAAGGNVLQGFMPHQYRNTGNACVLPFNGMEYATPHGKMKMAEGSEFHIDYKFYGMLPYYAVPNDTERAKNPYDETKMLEMLRSYADKGTFGADTYWGGKGLTQMALNMMFAREMGQKELFEQCRSKLKTALVNWLTYTPGERNYFFARYDRWGALVGYNTSYDSETFNDHHFHYGYFTYAAALLALVDNDFRNNYGGMMTLVAKDYANWDRRDTRFPLFRTFDPWAGHSFAGGMGDDNGNGQESSSEAMQGWGGLYLLGVALGDDGMRDAGIFGWLSEARGTAEYWFDRHEDPATGQSGYHTVTGGDYNIPYSIFRDGDGFAPPYNSNLTCHGVGWWTYFGYDAIFMQGIQWMPISPALDYLSEDKAYAAWDYSRMWRDKRIGGWLEADKTAAGYLGNSGGWGNVALSYLQRSDPDGAAEIFDMCWNAGEPEFKSFDTNGITYFVTHSHLSYGDIDWNIHADIPTARVYVKNGVKTYMAFNPTDAPINVRFSDGGILPGVPARRLAVSGTVSKDNTTITEDINVPADPREEIEMVNLALRKPVTTSGDETPGFAGGNAVDGKDDTRWASLKEDHQWIAVDLGKSADIYKIKIHWEAAFAPEFKVMLSADGRAWTEAKTVKSGGGWDEIMMGDASARHIRIDCSKRLADNWGYSIYELQVFGKYSDAKPTDLLGFKITSAKDVLKQHEQSEIGIKGYTCGGEWVDVVPEWSTADGSITRYGLFTPSVYPRATVKAKVGVTEVFKTFPVEEALFTAYLSLSPHAVEIPLGETQDIEVTAKNQFKEPMAADFTAIEWKVCDVNNTPVGGLNVNQETAAVTAVRNGNYRVIAMSGVAADTISVTVKAYADINLALNKPVTATSKENDGMSPEKAVDGDLQSRWASAWTADQDFTVDLLGIYGINKVVVFWETARAKEYDLQVSEDGKTWRTVRNVKDSPINGETITFGETPARYVRMHGIRRAMEAYGYSIFEFQVYGTRKIADIEKPTGIGIAGYDIPTDADIYSVDGMVVGKGLESLKGLRPGIYIVNGKKVVK